MKNLRSFLIASALLMLPGLMLAQDAKKKTEVIYIQTSAICDECKEKIETSVSNLKGVKKADLNMENKKVRVEYVSDKVTAEDIRTAISKTGYDADEVMADGEAYEKLPKCCQKDAEAH